LTKSRENIEVLLALSKEETTIYSSLDVKKINVARVLNRLINRGLVIKEGKQYSLTDPLFKYWIKRIILGIDKTECV